MKYFLNIKHAKKYGQNSINPFFLNIKYCSELDESKLSEHLALFRIRRIQTFLAFNTVQN